jgi:hypothetical protein
VDPFFAVLPVVVKYVKVIPSESSLHHCVHSWLPPAANVQCEVRCSRGQVRASRLLFLPLVPDRIAGRRRGAKATEVARATPSDESRFYELICLLKFSGWCVCVRACVRACVQWRLVVFTCGVLCWGIQEMHTEYLLENRVALTCGVLCWGHKKCVQNIYWETGAYMVGWY